MRTARLPQHALINHLTKRALLFGGRERMLASPSIDGAAFLTPKGICTREETGAL